MKKIVYAKDLKDMRRIFCMDDDTFDYLADIASEINHEKTEICRSLQYSLLYGTSISAKRCAINVLIVYFSAICQAHDWALRYRLRETTWAVAKLLKCGSYQLRQWLQGLALSPHYSKYVDMSDCFGLNYLEVNL